MLLKADSNSKCGNVTEYVPTIDKNTSFAKMKPFIDEVERAYIKPLLGTELYANLDFYYNHYIVEGDTTNPPDEEYDFGAMQPYFDELLPLIQKPLAYLAYWKGFARLAIRTNDGGHSRPDGKETTVPFHYQEIDAVNDYRDNGFTLLDDIYTYLVENSNSFYDWDFTAKTTAYNKHIITSPEKFSEYYFINDSYLVFKKLTPVMNNVEELTIRKFFNDDTLFNKFRYHEELTEAEQTLVIPLEQATVNFTIAEGLMGLATEISTQGILFNSIVSTIQNVKEQRPAQLNLIKEMQAKAKEIAELYLKQIDDLMVANELKTESGTAQVYGNDKVGIFIAL